MNFDMNVWVNRLIEQEGIKLMPYRCPRGKLTIGVGRNLDDNPLNREEIKALGVKCGAVINPDTPVSAIAPVIEECDMLLLMSVFPGFGGQKFIEYVLPKIKEARELINSTGKDIDLEIDGGITKENIVAVKNAGANVIVAGSTVFNEPDRAKIIKELREM